MDPMTSRPMTLGEMQREFSLCVAHLIYYIYSRGYAVSFGDAYRDPRAFGVQGDKPYILNGIDKVRVYGEKNSAHKNRLAIDLNLFDKNGAYLSSTEAHKEFGEHWKSLHFAAKWGGDFAHKDGNHYSFAFQGVA